MPSIPDAYRIADEETIARLTVETIVRGITVDHRRPAYSTLPRRELVRLTSEPRVQIRVCADPRCGQEFLDRLGRQRWCSLACRMRSYYHRRRPAARYYA